MARQRSKLRILLEYGAVRTALAVLRALPTQIAFSVADGLGGIAYRIDGSHRRTALTNVKRVLGDELSEAEIRELVRDVFRNFLRVGVELALLPGLLRKRGLRGVIAIEGEEHVRAAYAAGKGVIVYSAHLGNWEAIAAAGEPLGMKLHTVGRALDNPLLDRLLMEHRSRYARSVIPKSGGLRKIVEALRNGCGVAMLIDQHAGRDGILVDFLGRPAATFRAPAEIAWKLGLPILGGFGVRVPQKRRAPGATGWQPLFRLEFQEPLIPDPNAPREAEVRRLTQAMSDRIAHYVRRHPEQWNWLHRRWRDVEPAPAGVAAASETRA